MRNFIFVAALSAALSARAAPLTVTTASAAAKEAFEKGRDAYENHQNALAESSFRKALRLDPAFPSALSYLGMQIGGEEGRALARKAVEHADRLPEVERLLLQSHLQQLEGNEKGARASLRAAAQLGSDDWRLQYYAGRRTSIDRFLMLATVYLRKATQLNPKAAPPWNVLGYVLADQNDFDGAIEALKNYEKLLPNDPNPPDSLAEICTRAGRLDEASAAYRREQERAPDATYGYLGEAQVEFLRGDFTAAIKAALKGIEVAPVLTEKQQAERMLAWGYLAAGRSDNAFKQIREAEALAHKQKSPFHEALALTNEALMRIEKHDAEEALARAQEALAAAGARGMSGDQSLLVRRRAQVAVVLAALQLGKQQEAAAAGRELATLHRELPENKEMGIAFRFATGVLALARGDKATAIAELSKCAEINAYCGWKLLDAQAASGDTAGAAATREAILGSRVVDQYYLDEDPVLIYVHSRLAQK